MAMCSDAKLVIAAGLLVGLAGCAPVDPGLGEALRYDVAVQTINPDPVYPADGAEPGDSGEKGAEAVKRYRKGDTKELRIESSSEAGGGGSGPQ